MQFTKSGITGLVATAVDYLALILLVEWLNVPVEWASIPALLLGAAIQFLGCKYYAFESYKVSAAHQLFPFAIVEVFTLIFNALVFHLLVKVFLIPYTLARPLGTFLVFCSFSYILWAQIFRESN